MQGATLTFLVGALVFVDLLVCNVFHLIVVLVAVGEELFAFVGMAEEVSDELPVPVHLVFDARVQRATQVYVEAVPGKTMERTSEPEGVGAR